MPIRTEVVEIPNGRKVTAMQLSYLADHRLFLLRRQKANEGKNVCDKCKMPTEGLNLSTLDILKECLSKDDFDYLEELTRAEADLIIAAINRVNGWDRVEKDFQQAGKASSDLKPASSSDSAGIVSSEQKA